MLRTGANGVGVAEVVVLRTGVVFCLSPRGSFGCSGARAPEPVWVIAVFTGEGRG
jgi:hypothetical protein